ncbi:hypothetical protein RJG79_07110 [Mycoplasmatota bacterium WC44]
MKKLFSLVSALAIILVLTACKEPETVYVNVPGPTEYVEVEVPVEVIVTETVTEIVTEVVTEYVEVPINVEYERYYKPGVYFNNTTIDDNGVYTYVVVIVDEYGKIAGIMFDDTKSTSEFFIDEDGRLYVFIEGDGKTVPHTYRYIRSDAEFDDYPTTKDAITRDDLVMGIHQVKIETLTKVQTNETSRILGEEWVIYTDLLSEKIIEDQTTFGINLLKSGNEVTTTNIQGVKLTNVDVYLNLVQEILNNDASEPVYEDLKTIPQYGLYTQGGKFGASRRIVGDSIFYYISFVAVDEYGRIAGVYNDATVNGLDEDEHATKWILKEDYDMSDNGDEEWYLQAKAFGKAIVRNQGVNGFTLYNDKDFDEEASVLPEYENGHFIFDNEDQNHIYTNQVAGMTIGVEGIITATNDALSKLSEWELQDGTYFVKGSGNKKHSILALTIENNVIESIFIDGTEGTDQAEVYIEDEWFSLYKFNRTWIDNVDDQHVVTILVYKDGKDYHSLYDVEYDDEDIDKDDEIRFEDGEKSTLEPVSGNNTILSLGDRYGLEKVSDLGSWKDQISKFTKFFIGETNPYKINLDKSYTDSIAGVSIDVDDYHRLLVKALILANDDDNALIKDVDSTKNAPDLANGIYFDSLEPNEDGEQPFAFMNVSNNKIQSIIFDCTLNVGDLVTTKLSLGDDYGLKKEEDQNEWYEQSAMFSVAILENQREIIRGIEEDYNYKENGGFGIAPYHIPDSSDPDDFELDLDSESGVTISINEFQLLTDKLIQQALTALVEERAQEILDSIITGDEPLVSGQSYDIEMSSDLEIGNGVLFEVDWDTSDNDVFDIDEIDNEIDVEELRRDEYETLTLTLTYDRVDYEKEVDFEFLTELSYEIISIEDYIEGLGDLVIVEGYDYKLPSQDCEYISADWLWFDEDDDRIYSTEDLSDGKHTLTLQLEYDDGDFVKREVQLTIVDLDEAMEEVVENLSPSNILNNGEVTEEGTTILNIDSKYRGITISWDVEVDDDADNIDFEDNQLVINRSYENEKVVLTATVENGLNDDKEIIDFDFTVLAASPELVEKRIKSILESILNNTETKLPDPIVDTKPADGTDDVKIITLDDLIDEDDFPHDNVDIIWTVQDEDGDDINYVKISSGDLRVTDIVEDTAYLKFSCRVDINEDGKNDVIVEKVFVIELFISTTVVE